VRVIKTNRPKRYQDMPDSFLAGNCGNEGGRSPDFSLRCESPRVRYLNRYLNFVLQTKLTYGSLAMVAHPWINSIWGSAILLAGALV
jgi:hypothetical protein